MKLKLVCASVLLLAICVTEVRASIEQQVSAIFQEKCAACHDEGDEDPVLTQTTDLTALRINADYIKAGDAAASPLYKLLNLPDGDKKRMPKSKASKPLPPLSEEEKAIIAQWINGSTEVAARDFITEDQVAKAVLADVQKLGAKAAGVRYLSLANLFNEVDARGGPLRSDADLDYYRTGVSKMLNSLSWKQHISPVQVVDTVGAVVKFTLSDYGISPDVWKKLASAYPYRVDRGLSAAVEAEKALGVLPLMRADFVIFALAQPPLYHEVLGIPGGQKQRAADVALEAKLGIDYDKAILSPDAVRAGFQNSGVSQGNRLIERLPRPDGGYYWKSYDFDPTRQNERGADLFRAPLGPPNGQLTSNPDMKFLHDGGEIVFSLPNGLQGYMLTDGKGLRLDEAPTTVVTDKSRKDSRIINGISCMSCHRDGLFMTGVKDEILSASESLKLAPEDRATLERLHEQAKLEHWFQTDSAAYFKAVAQCGPAGEKETVSLLYDHFKEPLSPAALRAELGDSSTDLLEKLGASANESVKTIAAKFRSGAPVPRVDFEKVFPALVAELSLGTVPVPDRLAFTEFGGNIDNNLTILDEGSAGVTVRPKERKVKDQRVIDAADPAMSDDVAGGGGIQVKRHAPGTRPGMDRTEQAKKVIRILPDGSVAPPEAATASPPGHPEAVTPTSSEPTTKPSGRKVFKIVTPRPGEDDFNTTLAPPSVKPVTPPKP